MADRMTADQERLARLEARLRYGFDKIGQAMSEGIAVDSWERHFERLLREYEQLSDELASAAPEQVAMPGIAPVRREAA